MTALKAVSVMSVMRTVFRFLRSAVMSLKAFAVPIVMGAVLRFSGTAVMSFKAVSAPIMTGTVFHFPGPSATAVGLFPAFTLREGPGFGKDPSSFAVRLAEIAVSPASGTGFRVVRIILVFHFVPPIDNL